MSHLINEPFMQALLDTREVTLKVDLGSYVEVLVPIQTDDGLTCFFTFIIRRRKPSQVGCYVMELDKMWAIDKDHTGYVVELEGHEGAEVLDGMAHGKPITPGQVIGAMCRLVRELRHPRLNPQSFQPLAFRAKPHFERRI